MVRSGRLALPTPDWQTGALLLRHERMINLALVGFGRRLASRKSDRDCVLWPRINGQRFVRTKMVASTGFAPVSLGLKDRDPRLLDDKAIRAESSVPNKKLHVGT